MKRDYARYQVALKVLLRRGERVLLLRLADSSRWDLPGGRIDNAEARVPLKKILAREIREELGPRVKYKLGRPLFQFRRLPGTTKQNFLTVYEAKYLSGSIKLSFEHASYQWVHPGRFLMRRKDFFNREEYQAFKEYFQSRRHARY